MSLKKCVLVLFALMMTLVMSVASFAQDVVTTDPANSWIDGLINFLVGFGASNPKITPILAILFLVGVGAKLIREAVEKFVLATPSLSDDEKLKKAKESSVGKVVFFILDVLLRLKAPGTK